MTPSAAKPEYKTTGAIHYGRDTSQVFCLNYYPDGPPRALMIQINSGGWNSGPVKAAAPTSAKYLQLELASGVVCHRSLHKSRHPAQVNDVMNGVRYIKEHAKQWNIDPERIAVTGRSSGGHLAMWVALHPDAPKVACVRREQRADRFQP